MNPPRSGQNNIVLLLVSSCQNCDHPPAKLTAKTVMVVISPKVKKVRNVNGFKPVMYALRKGIYCEPNIRPAPNAAATPRIGCAEAAWELETKHKSTAPTNITSAPPTTPNQRNQPARCSSLKEECPR